MTNAEMYKSKMAEYDIAQCILLKDDRCKFCSNNEECDGGMFRYAPLNCREYILRWLESEASNDK